MGRFPWGVRKWGPKSCTAQGKDALVDYRDENAYGNQLQLTEGQFDLGSALFSSKETEEPKQRDDE